MSTIGMIFTAWAIVFFAVIVGYLVHLIRADLRRRSNVRDQLDRIDAYYGEAADAR